MAFTGKLGTKSSELGNIVFGISDGLGVGPLGFDVHVLSADEVRVRFTVKVGTTALDLSNYSLTSIAPPGTAVTPTLIGARFQDDRRRAVILSVSPNMTSGTDYSLEVSGVEDESGDVLVDVARNFTANVPAPPKALGAFQSKRGFIDIVFDKPVGLNSSSASFEIRDASSPGPGVPMAQPPWVGEAIPEDTLRVSIPGGTPPAAAFAIDYFDVTDTSLNSATGTVPVTLAIRSTAPHSVADLLQFQITDAYVLGGDFEYLLFGIVRVYWNGPAGVNQAFPETQFTLFQSGPHPEPDRINDVTAPDAVDLPSLLTLCSDFKAKFNAHLVQAGVHLRDDPSNAVTSPDPTDLPTAADFLNEAQDRLLAHFRSTSSHLYRDSENEFNDIVATPGNLPLALAIANQSLKGSFNSHLQEEREVQLLNVQPGVMNKVSDRASEPSTAYDVRSAYAYFTDLHMKMDSALASVRIEASVPSQDTLSSTNPGDFTGSFTARPYADPARVQSHLVTPDEALEVRLTGEVLLPPPGSLSVLGPSKPVRISSASVRATLANVAANVNFLIVAFNQHRSGNSFAGHEQNDSFNSISSGVFTPELQDVIDKANELKAKLNSHVRNQQAPFHLHADPRQVTAPDAADLPSLIKLVEDIRDTYVSHNEEGPHYRPGFRVYAADLHDVLRVETGEMVDGAQYVLRGGVRSSSLQLPGNGELGTAYPFQSTVTLHFLGEARLEDVGLDLAFTGLASRPALASALPKSGLDVDDGGRLVFESDQVEVYFSKPMARVVLDSSNLPVTGGGILQKEADWIDDRTASVRVVNMDPVPYTVTAVGLTDAAGNPVV